MNDGHLWGQTINSLVSKSNCLSLSFFSSSPLATFSCFNINI